MGPKISVIIPVYNVEAYIGQCLDSIISQTYHNFETIIIDNSSTDESGKICDEYAQKDKRIRVIHKKNEGVGVSRNLGIREARGEWLTFIDSDDWVAPDYLENLMDCTLPESIDIVFSGGYIEEGPKEQRTERHFDKTFEDETPEFRRLLISKILAANACRDKMRNGINLGTTWGKLYRVDMFRTHSLLFLPHIEPGMDTLFQMKTLNIVRSVRCCPYIGYHYRYAVPTGAMHRFHPEVVQTSYDYVAAMWKYNEENHVKVDDDVLYARALLMVMQAFKTFFLHPENTASYANKAKWIREYKQKPLVHRVIFRKSNAILTYRQIAFKYTLRLPGAGAIQILYFLYCMIKKV